MISCWNRGEREIGAQLRTHRPVFGRTDLRKIEPAADITRRYAKTGKRHGQKGKKPFVNVSIPAFPDTDYLLRISSRTFFGASSNWSVSIE